MSPVRRATACHCVTYAGLCCLPTASPSPSPRALPLPSPAELMSGVVCLAPSVVCIDGPPPSACNPSAGMCGICAPCVGECPRPLNASETPPPVCVSVRVVATQSSHRQICMLGRPLARPISFRTPFLPSSDADVGSAGLDLLHRHHPPPPRSQVSATDRPTTTDQSLLR